MIGRAFWQDLGWLVVLVVTFAVPLLLDAMGHLSYFTSLWMWALPIAYLWPLFREITRGRAEQRRRALHWSIGAIVGLGVMLDFVLGHLTLRFDGCSDHPVRAYVLCLPAFSGRVPIEEVLFYAMGKNRPRVQSLPPYQADKAIAPVKPSSSS